MTTSSPPTPRPTSSLTQPTAKPTLRDRARTFFPPGQVVRYLIVGLVNTAIGLGASIFMLWLFNRVFPPQLHGIALTQPRLTVAASIVVTPFTITIAYLNYKFFVFRTRGNFLREWLKAFGVYGVSTLIGWIGLGLLTRLVEILLDGHAPFGKGTPGYIAMAAMTGVTCIISYIGHKKYTFGGTPGYDEDLAASEAFLSAEAPTSEASASAPEASASEVSASEASAPELSARLDAVLQEPPQS